MTEAVERDRRKRVREPYLPETVRQALASAKRLRKQLSNAKMATPYVQGGGSALLWVMLESLQMSAAVIEGRLRNEALELARNS